MDFTSLLVGVPILFALLCEAGYRGSQGSGFVQRPKSREPSPAGQQGLSSQDGSPL